MSTGGIFRPGMRTYFIPLASGLTLAASAFLPWVTIGDVTLAGFRDVSGLWIVGLGALAVSLAMLSLITRKNSRHPLLVVGLASFGIMFLSWRIVPRLAGERALTVNQAFSIVEDRPAESAPAARAGSGIYLGLVSSAALSAFGFTIVLKRASQPYIVASADDDV